MTRTLLALLTLALAACGTMPTAPAPQHQLTPAECAALALKLQGRLPSGDTLPDALKPYYPSGSIGLSLCRK